MKLKLYKDQKTSFLGAVTNLPSGVLSCVPEIVDLSENDVYSVEHRFTERESLPYDWAQVAEIEGDLLYLARSTIRTSRSIISQWSFLVTQGGQGGQCAYTEGVAGEWIIAQMVDYARGEVMAAVSCGGELTLNLNEVSEVNILRRIVES